MVTIKKVGGFLADAALALAMCAGFFSLGGSALAADTVNVLPGITHNVVNGGTNYIPAATTNVYRGTGTVWSLVPGQASVPGGQTAFSRWTINASFVCTNANGLVATTDGLLVNFDGGISPVQTDQWQTNAFQIFVPGTVAGSSANLTNSVVTNITVNLPQWLYPFYRLGEIWNTNASATNYVSLRVRVLSQ